MYKIYTKSAREYSTLEQYYCAKGCHVLLLACYSTQSYSLLTRRQPAKGSLQSQSSLFACSSLNLAEFRIFFFALCSVDSSCWLLNIAVTKSAGFIYTQLTAVGNFPPHPNDHIHYTVIGTWKNMQGLVRKSEGINAAHTIPCKCPLVWLTPHREAKVKEKGYTMHGKSHDVCHMLADHHAVWHASCASRHHR